MFYLVLHDILFLMLMLRSNFKIFFSVFYVLLLECHAYLNVYSFCSSVPIIFWSCFHCCVIGNRSYKMDEIQLISTACQKPCGVHGSL